MPFYIDRELNIYNHNPVSVLPELISTNFVNDTEFTKDSRLKKLLVNCIGIYLPQLFPDYMVVFTYEELTNGFHPINDTLKAFGYNIEPAKTEKLMTVIEDMQETFNGQDETDFSQSTRQIKKHFKEMVEQGYFDHHLSKLNIPTECISLEHDKHSDAYSIVVRPPTILITFLSFYGFADIFKIWGKNYQNVILNSNLVQQRSLKLRNAYGRATPIEEYNYISGELKTFKSELREVMYRFPPRSKGLEAQTNIFEVQTRKINVKNWKIATALGFENLNDVMENFTKFLKEMPEDALRYHATDVFATWDLHLKQQEFYDVILAAFQLEPIEVADTTGTNVSKFIIECIKDHFKTIDKESEKLVKQLISLGTLDNLEKSPLNDFGCQPFLTVGGLLFSRMAKFKFIEGYLSDCDLKSCYASFMSMMNVYLGEPVTLTCKYDKYKITLREALELIENQNVPHDGWFIRASGRLDKAVNTLVLSDLKFKPKSVNQQNLYEVNDNRKSIENFNAYKTSKRQAQSAILTKEIKFGLFTKSTIEALKKLPPEWYEEYLNLPCEVVSFYPGDLITHSLSEYNQLVASLPEQDRVEKFNIKQGAKSIDGQRYKNNACLAFPIHEYWSILKAKRGEFKKAKNPVQEVFKLFQNSGYGVLACLFLPANNLMASNQITAGARSGAWLMTYALNGCAPITDGTAYSWEHIPIGKTFHEILTSNPSYLEHFDESIKSGIKINSEFKYQTWIDGNLKQHLMSFYGVGEDDYNLNQFDYELKTENFLTAKGKKWFDNNPKEVEELKHELGTNWDKYLQKNGYVVETPLFTKFYNNNAGNYCKGMNGGSILIEGSEFDIVDNEPFVKARSFQGGEQALIDWYCKSIGNKYEEPIIYSETKLIKFGDGNKIAIRFLESGSEEIVHPMGFDTKGYKMMKLISRSQFLFRTELQLRNFETNEETLACLSKELGLNQPTFWKSITSEDVSQYGVEIRENVDYMTFARSHPVGIGFELLALAKSAKGDVNVVRRRIVELIEQGCKDFSPGLNLKRNFKNAESLKNLFAAVIIAKKNADDDLRELLENSASEPTLLTVKSDNIKHLRDLLNNSEV